MLRDEIVNIFKRAQQNKTSFQKQQEKLKKIYEQVRNRSRDNFSNFL